MECSFAYDRSMLKHWRLTLTDETFSIRTYSDTLSGVLFTNMVLIPAWISNHILSKGGDDIINPFPNFNGCR